MANMLDTLIQTISKDITGLTELSDDKLYRKERSLLIKRIDSALKLVKEDSVRIELLEKLKNELG